MTKKNELAERKTADIQEFDPMSVLEQEQGNEDISSDQCSIPYLNIADKQSKVVDEDNSEYIEGIKPGHIYNNLSGEFFEEITIIPCKIREVVKGWKDRTPTGTYSKDHPVVQNAIWKEDQNGKMRKYAEDGSQLQDTFELMVIYMGPEGKPGQAILSMAGAKYNVAKKLNSRIKTLMVEGKNPAKYMQQYKITTLAKNHSSGSKYYIYDFDFVGLVNDANVFEAAKMLATMDSPADDNEVSEGSQPDVV